MLERFAPVNQGGSGALVQPQLSGGAPLSSRLARIAAAHQIVTF